MVLCYSSLRKPAQGTSLDRRNFLQHSTVQQKDNVRYVILNFLIVILKSIKKVAKLNFNILFHFIYLNYFFNMY